MQHEILAIIPARGGSKGLPRKNVLPLAGIPLIAHTILAARAAKTIDRVVVSTDDDEIADVAQQYGADVVRRPAALASDTAKSEDALLHVLDDLEAREGYLPDVTVFLQCTSPFTSADDIDGTVGELLAADADSALAVTIFHYFLWERAEDGALVGVNHDKSVRLMRQQRKPEFIETGAVYVMRTEGLRATRHRFFGKTVMHETPIERRLEIDDPADFRIAEERIAHMRSAAPATGLGAVKAIAMDFDGVFTDDRVIVDQDGRESVICSRSDGMGIEHLRNAGIPMIVISKEKNPVVAARCQKLALPYHFGIDHKLALLTAWLDKIGINATDAAYVGNDVNDVECLRLVGCAIVPRDAHPAARAAADIVLDAPGGRGALRLLADMMLEQRR